MCPDVGYVPCPRVCDWWCSSCPCLTLCIGFVTVQRLIALLSVEAASFTVEAALFVFVFQDVSDAVLAYLHTAPERVVALIICVVVAPIKLIFFFQIRFVKIPAVGPASNIDEFCVLLMKRSGGCGLRSHLVSRATLSLHEWVTRSRNAPF